LSRLNGCGYALGAGRKSAGVWVCCNAFELPNAIAQPHNHGVRTNQISPDQVGVAVVVEILREQRAIRFGLRVEMKPRERARAAKEYLYVLAQSGDTQSRPIGRSISIEIREGQ
jgi:hypothetical protein